MRRKITITRFQIIGQRKPSVIWYVIPIVSLTLLLMGMFISRVIPSTLSITIGLLLGSALGIYSVVYIERKLDNEENIYFDGDRILRNAWLRVPFIFLLLVGWSYISTTWACSWLFNMTFGKAEERVVIVEGWNSGSTRNCAQPDVGLPLFSASVRAFCVSASKWEMPEGTRLRIVGKSSVFGMNVEDIYILDSPRH